MKRHIFADALCSAVTAGVLLATTAALAQVPAAMAPPVQTSSSPSGGNSVGADSVFNWQEIPQNQQVPLTSGSFDQGGYQLYDTVGETIVVPFTDQNLYVMQFARSSTGTMYFVNQSGVPILYVPRHGYLSNATVSGARWYPFSKGFTPSQPVYLGIAPSWSVFSGMGWYPNMYYHGGYWSQTSFLVGGVFGPSVGLFFRIGGQPYYGWNGYRQYALGHPGFARIGYYHRDLYRFAGRPRVSPHSFGGANHASTAHRAFAGAGGFAGHRGLGGNSAGGGTRAFRGGSNSRPNGQGASQGFGGQRSGFQRGGGVGGVRGGGGGVRGGGGGVRGGGGGVRGGGGHGHR